MGNPIRDQTGKFLPGNPGSPGRGTKAFEERYELAYKQAITEDDVTKIMTVAVAQAREGDRYAREFVFDRLFGPVSNVVNQGGSIQLIMDGLGITLEKKVEEICPDKILDLPPEFKP